MATPLTIIPVPCILLFAGVALTKNQKEHKWEADDDSDNESLFTEKSLELRQVGCFFSAVLCGDIPLCCAVGRLAWAAVPRKARGMWWS